MSSSTRSAGRLRNASRACRPFSAKATRCPNCSRVRATSSRLTRLSSTTRSSPFSALRSGLTLDLPKRPRDPLALASEALHPGGRSVQAAGPRQVFEIFGEGGQGHGAETGRVGFERVRGPSERVGVLLPEGAPHRAHEILRALQEG